MRLLRLLGVILILTGCASTGSVVRPMPFPRPAGRPASPLDSAPTGAVYPYAVAGTALSLQGAPYRFGGADPRGFDCSGFVQYVFAQHAIALPRQVPELYQVGATIEREAIEPGDLLFFSTIAPGPSHVAIALGGDDFVHAPSASGEVRVERISAPYWSLRFLGARRVLATD